MVTILLQSANAPRRYQCYVRSMWVIDEPMLTETLVFFYSRQIYGGIGIGVAAAAVISMFALSNVSCFPCEMLLASWLL